MRPLPLAAVCTAAVLLFSGSSSAQLSDLQPGRNFPTAVNQFGAQRAENIDLGDVDNDGDYDVVVANGGDGAAEANRIYVNNGGLQAGTVGTFSHATSARFSGVTVDTSRDIELVDVESDGDLDVYVSNRGTTVNGGEVSRAYTNLGGLQLGAIGYFSETTDGFWGDLVSVPLSREEGVQDGHGPWRDFSCDCDFADLDDDGDLDLFHSSYGPNIQGTEDSRVFLNDGAGVFDELWPWANAGADIQLHTLDIDLLDIDDDYDIDVFGSSRDSQARVYRNNLGAAGWSGDPFTDVTQSALINTGATLNGSNNYEAEYADLDGDGDFDMWMKNYDGGGGGNLDRILRNDGSGAFTKMTTWIRGDPNTDENEVDFFDYDSDGDLDAFVANFLGANWIYQGGLAQGLTSGQGYYHRNGSTASGNLATWSEDPTNAQTFTSLDGECADMDNDGDPDILISNDGGSPNRYWANTLGVPDTHGPTFHQFSVQGNKSDGTDTVIHAQLRDNASYYVIAYYDVRLVYSVDGGPEVCQKMFSQGSQQFRGVIPAAVNGSVDYRIEATDDNGNTGVSSTVSYTQTSSAASPWQQLGCGTPGVYGAPYLEGSGTGVVTIKLVDAAPSAAAMLWMGVSSTPLPFKGGTFWIFPIIVNLPLVTGSGGEIVFPMDLSALPTGFPIYWQYGIQDGTAQGGVAISNAILSTAP